MGCQKKVLLGDNLVFGIATHDPDTGVLTDTDSNPIYRVYEEENATPVSGGNMTKLDDANTTGFYTAMIVCTQRNGFQVSKTYTIYIEAIVDSDMGGMCYAFKVKPSWWSNAVMEGIDVKTKQFHHIIGRFRRR